MVTDEGEDEDEHEDHLPDSVDDEGSVENKEDKEDGVEEKTEGDPKNEPENAPPEENNITPTATRHDRSPSPPDPKHDDESNENLEESQATIKPTKETLPGRNSDHDSGISLNSPAQARTKSTSKSRSRSSRPETISQEAVDEEQKGNRTPTNATQEDNVTARERERDIETWVTKGQPPTDQKKAFDAADDVIQKHTHAHNQSTSTTTRAVPGGLRLDFLGTGENRWAARPARRRLDTESEDYGDDGGSDEDDDALTRSDHCATSPYSVD